MENTYDRLKHLNRKQIELIHKKSVEILEKTGFWFDSKKPETSSENTALRLTAILSILKRRILKMHLKQSLPNSPFGPEIPETT